MVLYRVVWCGIMLYGFVSCCSVLYIDIYICGWFDHIVFCAYEGHALYAYMQASTRRASWLSSSTPMMPPAAVSDMS